LRGLDHVAHFFELSLLKDFAELQVVFVAQDPVVMLLEGERDVLRLLSLNGPHPAGISRGFLRLTVNLSVHDLQSARKGGSVQGYRIRSLFTFEDKSPSTPSTQIRAYLDGTS